MISDSTRTSLYEYMTSLFEGVTDNIYPMSVPTETNKRDAEEGFLVTNVGNVYDESEFKGETYGWVRCQVTAYVPKKTRGRFNKELYGSYENAIKGVIDANTGLKNDNGYYIMDESVLSMEDNENTQQGNQYHVFIKSFVVVIDQ